MRIVFMGSGELGCPAVESLLAAGRDELVAAVTQPDRPQGRKLQLAPCPAKKLLTEHGLPVLTPEKISDPAVLRDLAGLRPDVIVVAAYGQFLPRALLELPPHGVINIHPSLLPKYRGAAPVQWAIANGETETGVSIIYLIEKMDAGDILAQEKILIAPDDTTATLALRLAELSARLALRTLDDIRNAAIKRTPQNDILATRAPLLRKSDGRLDWTLPAITLHNRIRGFFPWPGCFLEWSHGSAKRVKVLRSEVVPGTGKPGELLMIEEAGLRVATSQAALRIITVQPEGKQSMSAAAFACGARLTAGQQLG